MVMLPSAIQLIVAKFQLHESFDCSEHLGNTSVHAKVCLCLSISLTGVPFPPNVVELSTQIKDMFETAYEITA